MAYKITWKEREDEQPDRNCLCVVVNEKCGMRPCLANYIKSKDLFMVESSTLMNAFHALDVSHYIELPDIEI